jgi:hypothetical protein
MEMPRAQKIKRYGKDVVVWRDSRGRFCKKPWVEEVRSAPLDVVSIRVDKKRWKQFVELCRRRGTSTCLEIRSYIDARLGGESVVTARHPFILHQTVMYQLPRPRRKPRLPEEPAEITVQYFGAPEKCAHCKNKPFVLGQMYVSPLECHKMYLCRVHHDYYKKRLGVGYSFKNL